MKYIVTVVTVTLGEEGHGHRSNTSPAKRARQTIKFFSFLHYGMGPLGAQGIPWDGLLGSQGTLGEGTLASPREPMGVYPWEPKGSHGMVPLGAQWIPWEETLGSPRDPMGGDPREPKGSHGRGPLGAQGIPWEGTLGSPGTTEDQFGGNWGLQEPFWMYSVMK